MRGPKAWRRRQGRLDARSMKVDRGTQGLGTARAKIRTPGTPSRDPRLPVFDVSAGKPRSRVIPACGNASRGHVVDRSKRFRRHFKNLMSRVRALVVLLAMLRGPALQPIKAVQPAFQVAGSRPRSRASKLRTRGMQANKSEFPSERRRALHVRPPVAKSSSSSAATISGGVG